MFGGELENVLAKRMANRAKCYNVNIRGVKPTNANAKACVARMKADYAGGRRTRRGSRKSRRSTRRSTRRSWF
jgi:hypothetical protein